MRPILKAIGLPDVVWLSQDTAATQGVVTVIKGFLEFRPTARPAGVAQTPIPLGICRFGVKITATPTSSNNNEVTLLLEFDIRSLDGFPSQRDFPSSPIER